MKLLVTAGGQGTKLWPVSREHTPKQFQPIVSDASLFKYTVDLLLKQYDPKDIVVSTKDKYLPLAYRDAPAIPRENYVVEPDIARNRGPGEGLAFLWLDMHYPDEVFSIVQSDDLRIPEEKYLEMLVEMERLVKRDKKLITGGEPVSEAILGIDYLQLGNKLQLESSMEAYEIAKFVDRPNEFKEIEDLVQSHSIVTHSNHNTWYPELMLKAYEKYQPQWHASLMKIKDIFDKPGYQEKIESIYAEMSAGATEEVTKHVFAEGYVILLPYHWIDIGSWPSVKNYLAAAGLHQAQGNVISIDNQDSFIKGGKKLIAALGLKDIFIIDTEDALLIADKKRVGDVKLILDELKKQGKVEYL